MARHQELESARLLLVVPSVLNLVCSTAVVPVPGTCKDYRDWVWRSNNSRSSSRKKDCRIGWREGRGCEGRGHAGPGHEGRGREGRERERHGREERAWARVVHIEHEEHGRQVSRNAPTYHTTTCGCVRGTQSKPCIKNCGTRSWATVEQKKNCLPL